jgi:hypothetical protein
MEELHHIEREIVIKRPSREELLRDNVEVLQWLGSIDPRFMEVYRNGLYDLLDEAPPSGTIKTIDLVRLGRSYIWPYTSKIRGVPIHSDPINVIFWNNANAGKIRERLVDEFIPFWNDVRRCSARQYVYIDNSEFGGEEGWIMDDYSLANCSCLGLSNRCHLRLFDSGEREPERYGNFTLGNIHYENITLDSSTLIQHRIIDWDESQIFLKSLFAESNLLGGKKLIRIQRNMENLQDVKNDGIGDAIELR